MLLQLLPLIQLFIVAPFAIAQNWTANPFNPPTIPLAVKTPYLQTWSRQGGVNDSLISAWPSFRDSGSVSHRLESFSES